MTDRELLEAAAKAFWADDEVSTRFDEREDGLLYIHADNQDHNGSDREFVWNPLHDDGDALRLAVKLKIDLSFYVEDELKSVEPFPVIEASWNACNFDGKVGHAEPLENDLYAASRRAIVCAAAEIGRAMP